MSLRRRCHGFIEAHLRAWELLLEAAWASPRGREIAATFGRIHQEVVLGQELDLVGSARVSRMQQLKTGSYTVAGPLRLGALFGEASEALVLGEL